MKRDKLIHPLLHGHSWMMLCKSRGLIHVQSEQPAQSVWGNRCRVSVLQLFLLRWHALLKLHSLCNVWFVSLNREPNGDTVKSPASTRCYGRFLCGRESLPQLAQQLRALRRD